MKSFRPKQGGDEPPGPGRKASVTSAVSDGATRHTPPPLTPMPGSIAKPAARRPSFALWVTC